MRKFIILLSLVLSCLCSFEASAQMTDDAIIKYLTEGVAAGKTESQLGAELLSKGVSPSQMQRLLKTYNAKTTGTVSTGLKKQTSSLDDGRVRRKKTSMDEDEDEEDSDILNRKKSAKGKLPKVPKTGKDAEKLLKGGGLDLMDEEDSLDLEMSKMKPGDIETPDGEKIIYGHNIFNSRKLSFEPNENVATPEDYVLGPGDEVIIDIWGANEATINQTITPDGRIVISQVGQIYLSGLTIKQARGKVLSAMSKSYASLSGSNPASHFSLTLGQVRSIQVSVMGEVMTPGVFRLSSFSTVFTALYKAGGVTPIGSLRSIKVLRGGSLLTTVDVYKYIFDAEQGTNIALREGDVIQVPPYVALVGVCGGVKRPMYYEATEGEPLSKLISYAGGFTGSAHADDICVERREGPKTTMYTVSSANMGTFAVRDADMVTVSENTGEIYANMAEVKGCVYRPGKFEIGGEIATVRQLIEHAGGLTDDAFPRRAQIIREKADRSREILAVPIKAIMDGTADDVALKKNDLVVVSNVNEVEEKGDFTITGYVMNPGEYTYADHTSVEDLILLAGGLVDGASTARVDVSRRLTDPKSTEASDSLAEVFSFSIKDGLMVDGTPDFELKPFDVVSVRRSPTYIEQRNVTISGEVTFPGQYTLVSNNERVSDLLKRAGGPTPQGNVRGGMLKRKINQYERNVRTTMDKIIRQGGGRDSIDVKKIKVTSVYTVGLELDKALQNPGSDYDVILRDGDELVIPEMPSTVRIQGEVLYPNTVNFITGMPVRYYVKQAGGFDNMARRSKVYVLYMNGTINTGLGAKVEPGCEIVVPRRSDKNKLTTGEWLGIGTSAASVTTMLATIINMFR